jgi:primosomal protein N' (replication factor Y)
MADARALVALVQQHGPHGRVLGPAPAPMAKIRDEYRAQFFLKGSRRRLMRQALGRALQDRQDLRRRTTVDVDPVSVL